MTQENTPVSVGEKILASSDSDVFLVSLINMAEKQAQNVKIDITLFVQGLIVSGVVIGEKSYFEGLYNDLNLSGSSPEEFFEHYQVLSEGASGEQQEKNQFTKNIDYIHLKDVSYNSLSQNNRGGYWRGKLNRVDGFRLGSLTSL
jgi:hypothetical protein